jgi:hypothetical protein
LSEIIHLHLTSLDEDGDRDIVTIHDRITERGFIATCPDDNLCLLTHSSVERLVICSIRSNCKQSEETESERQRVRDRERETERDKERKRDRDRQPLTSRVFRALFEYFDTKL